MTMLELTIDYDKFLTYLNTVKGRYSLMLQAMIDVAEVIHANTIGLTPRDTGRLGESYEWRVIEYNRELIAVELEMDAVDPDNGFHYAYVQHEYLDFHHTYGQAYYLRDGIQASKSMAYEIIESDYLSLFGGIKAR